MADRDRSGPLLIGLVLILVGGYLFARQYVPQLNVDVAWPYAAVALGIVLVVASLRPGPR